MCVPVCGWCLAWGHLSCLTIRHQVFGKPHSISKVFNGWFLYIFRAADTGFVSCAELHTLSCLWLHTRKHRLPVAERGLSWLEFMHIHRKAAYINKCSCKFGFFFFFLFFAFFVFVSLLSSQTYFSALHRPRHSAQRQRTGSSLPEGVPARYGVKPHRGVLLRTRPSLPAELHIQVQGYRGWGPETSVAPGVPECIAVGRGFTQVRAWTQLSFLLLFVQVFSITKNHIMMWLRWVKKRKKKSRVN